MLGISALLKDSLMSMADTCKQPMDTALEPFAISNGSYLTDSATSFTKIGLKYTVQSVKSFISLRIAAIIGSMGHTLAQV